MLLGELALEQRLEISLVQYMPFTRIIGQDLPMVDITTSEKTECILIHHGRMKRQFSRTHVEEPSRYC